ncbi:MAG: dipeptidase, partial [Bacteroidales bacterium]|nr:dipeptidase [Bacteroidales bacterium]
DYNKYAPIIKKRYARFEADMAASQKKLEAAFLKMSKGHEDAPAEAISLLQKWSDQWLTKALRVASDLEEKLFTELTKDIEANYYFHGA